MLIYRQHVQPPIENKSIELKDKAHTLLPEPILPKQQVKPNIFEPGTALPQVATKAFRKIKIVSDMASVKAIIPNQNSFENAEPGLVTADGALPGTVAPDIPSEAGNVTGDETESNSPFEVVEKMPQFPDGLTAMYKFINKHLRYPPEAQSHGLEGNVILTFV